jgi:hypoxanthine phosphoribosyltransferase
MGFILLQSVQIEDKLPAWGTVRGGCFYAAGKIIHFVAYVIIPLLVGGWILGRGLGLF